MDGVLIDSMDRHARAWLTVAGELEMFDIDELDIYRREGEKGEVSARDFLKAHEIMPTRKRIERFLARKEDIFSQMGPAMPFPRAEQVLEDVAGYGLPMALVTGTSRQELESVLPGNLKAYFRVIVTGDSVRHGKPGPEPYLKAALGLGVDPGRCLVIENAPYGLRSAKAAGCIAAVVPTSLPHDELPGADFLLDGIEQVPELLDRLISERA